MVEVVLIIAVFSFRDYWATSHSCSDFVISLVSFSRRFGQGRNTQHRQRDIGRKLPTGRKYKIMAPHLNILTLLSLVNLLERITCQTAGVIILKRG